jgi:predicted lipid-binding transport protein (Tim44 family)
MLRNSIRPLFVFLAIAATLAFAAAEVSAASRMSAGSRGSRTYSAPPATNTAPNSARPIERSATQPAQPGPMAAAPAAAAQPRGLFNRPGLMGGLAAGFLGAGLFGMLSGNGFMGGLADMASFFGLLLQVGLIGVVGMLAWRWWQRRNQPAMAFAGDSVAGDSARASVGAQAGRAFAGFGVGPTQSAIDVQPSDFDAFERILGDVQSAYSNEDLDALSSQVTPEMLAYYSQELAANAQQGVVNRLTDVKLLQGDLAEAWREGDEEYATVSIRYQQIDRVLDRKTGNVVAGADTPDVGVEYWTFRRERGGVWMVSAIQQTN